MSTKTLMTVEQYAQMDTTDTERFELVEGELIPVSSGTPLHAKVRDLLLFYLLGYFRKNPIGMVLAEIDCLLGEATVLCADISIFLADRSQRIAMRKVPIPFAPGIAAEVLSPSHSAMEVNRRIRRFLDAGCQEVWLLDTENGAILVHAPNGIRSIQATQQLESPLLPGFSVPVAELLMLDRAE